MTEDEKFKFKLTNERDEARRLAENLRNELHRFLNPYDEPRVLPWEKIDG